MANIDVDFGDNNLDGVLDLDSMGGGLEQRMRTRKNRTLVMFDSQRLAMYTAMTGLLEAGLSLETAASMLADQYDQTNASTSADSVRGFFGTVCGLIAAGERNEAAMTEIGNAVEQSFGAKFVGPEEMALLKVLVVTKNTGGIFERCARILEQAAREKNSGSIPRLRSVGH